MRIGNGTLVFRGGYTPQRRATEEATPGPDRQTFAAQLQKLDDELIDLREVLESARLGGVRRRAPLAQGVALGLSVVGTRAQLVSSQEVSTRSGSSVSTSSPSWQGGSTAQPHIGGTFNGTSDDTVTVTVDGVLGNGRARMTAHDAQGNEIGKFQHDPGDSSTVHTLDNGLSVRFDAGTFSKGDSFSFDVFVTADGTLDPDVAVGQTGPSGPGFDEGFTVTDGSFLVNGVEISVSTSDTTTDILNRITASSAGVVAGYDAASDRVVLSSSGTGADAVVELSGDTSGLLAALKLDGLAAARGEDPEADRVMADLAAFSSVQAGTLTINGTDVAIDPGAQSIRDVVAAIDEIDGVDAQLTADGRFRIVGEQGEPLTLSDTSGLLDAAGIAEGTYQGSRSRDRRISNLMARRIAAETQQVQTALEALAAHTEGAGLASRVGKRVEGLVADAFEGSLAGYARFNGLDDLDDGRSGPLSRGAREVRAAYGEVSTAWLGANGRGGGLLEDLQSVIDDAERNLLRLNVKV